LSVSIRSFNQGGTCMSTSDDTPDTPEEARWETLTGRVVDTDGEGRPVVDFEGNPAGPRVAGRLVPLEGEELELAIARRQPVRLRFEEGNARRPVIVGLASESEEAAAPRSPDEAGGDFQVLESRDGLIIRCGKASLTLLRNGKVVLKGTYVETYSEGVNRIKGGVVDIG
jgi:hypothetical protein